MVPLHLLAPAPLCNGFQARAVLTFLHHLVSTRCRSQIINPNIFTCGSLRSSGPGFCLCCDCSSCILHLASACILFRASFHVSPFPNASNDNSGAIAEPVVRGLLSRDQLRHIYKGAPYTRLRVSWSVVRVQPALSSLLLLLVHYYSPKCSIERQAAFTCEKGANEHTSTVFLSQFDYDYYLTFIGVAY